MLKYLIVIVFFLSLAGGVSYALFAQSRKAKPVQAVAIPSYQPKADNRGVLPNKTATPPTTVSATTPTIKAEIPTEIRDGSLVSGIGAANGGLLNYRLKGVQTGQVAEGTFKVSSDTAAAFSFTVTFEREATAGEKGSLEIYDAAGHRQVQEVTIR